MTQHPTPELAARATAGGCRARRLQRTAKTADIAERAIGARVSPTRWNRCWTGWAAPRPGPVSPSPAGDGSAGHPGNRTGHTAEAPAAAGLRAVLAGAAPPGSPARYPFSPAWEGQSRVMAGAARASRPRVRGAWAWSPLPGSGAGRFAAPQQARRAPELPAAAQRETSRRLAASGRRPCPPGDIAAKPRPSATTGPA